jgi:hypothetical protein
MKKKKSREEEMFYWKIKRYSGPKTPFKVGVSIVLFVCFMSGFMMLASRPMPTGYAVSEVSEKSWLGLTFLLIPLILALYWLKRFKSVKT